MSDRACSVLVFIDDVKLSVFLSNVFLGWYAYSGTEEYI